MHLNGIQGILRWGKYEEPRALKAQEMDTQMNSKEKL